MWIAVLYGILSVGLSSALEFSNYECKPVIDTGQATVKLPFDTLTNGQFTDGTYTSSTEHGTPQTVTGKVGQALSLDGSTAISIGASRESCFWDVAKCSDGFTLAFWVYNVNRDNNDLEPYLFSNGGQTRYSYGVSVVLETGSHGNDRGLVVAVSTGEKTLTIIQDSWRNHAKDDTWNHVVIMLKDDRVALYENGQFVSAADLGTRDPTRSDTDFDKYSFGLPNNDLDSPDDRFWGQSYVDEFLFWDTWKRETFILDLYNSYQDTSSLSECGENHQCTNGVCECINGKAGTNCDVERQVLMRVATDTRDAGTVYTLWTADTFTPAIGDSLGPEYFSLSVNDKQRYKSALVEQAWSKMKNVRYSYYKDGVEVAYFSSTAEGTDKNSWFGKSFVYDSSFNDLVSEPTFNYFSIAGHTGTVERRYFVNRNYGGCEVDKGWFVLLDTDHQNNCDWETFDDLGILPFLMYCPEKTACLTSGYHFADVMMVSADMGGAFGGSCVSSCVGVADGNYQSCLGCNVYVVCASQTLTNTPCRSGTRFDSSQGSCVESSNTCNDGDADTQGLPDGCATNPCKNGGQCSMGDTGWECDCSTDSSGYGGHTCEDIESYCTAHSGENVCNDGTCVDGDNGQYSCTCDSGYTGDNCETETFCTANPGHCQNGGVCVDNGVVFSECTCGADYMGTTCEHINQCVQGGNPCQNSAACTPSSDGAAQCACTSGWMGATCGEEDVCTTNNPCANGGACGYAEDGSAECTCANGWLGDTCSVEDPCGSDPCQNGGTCTVVLADDGTHSAQCTCADHFSGDNCEEGPCQTGDYVDQCAASVSCTNNADGTCEVVTACTSNPCSNNGVCSVSDGGYSCDCSNTGYSGDQCTEEGSVGSAGQQSGDENAAASSTAQLLGSNVMTITAGLMGAVLFVLILLIILIIRRRRKEQQEAECPKEEEPQRKNRSMSVTKHGAPPSVDPNPVVSVPPARKSYNDFDW